MPVVDTSQWRTVAGVSTTLVGLTALAGVALPLATDHLWVLVALAVSAAVARAAGSGGARSVFALVGAVLITQPVLHVLTERAHVDDHDLAGDSGLLGLLILSCHIALTAALVAVLAAGESACWFISATFQRLARVLVWSIGALSGPSGSLSIGDTPELSREQRDGAPRPPLRGPPPALVSARF